MVDIAGKGDRDFAQFGWVIVDEIESGMLGVAGQGLTTVDVLKAQGDMVEQNVAPGIQRVEVAFTNFYLVEDEGGVTIVDACVPTAWDPLHEALRATCAPWS